MQSVIINTNYAKFEIMQDKNGTVFERHSNYNKCCFTEWEETMYNSIEDAEKGIYLYCSDY